MTLKSLDFKHGQNERSAWSQPRSPAPVDPRNMATLPSGYRFCPARPGSLMISNCDADTTKTGWFIAAPSAKQNRDLVPTAGCRNHWHYVDVSMSLSTPVCQILARISRNHHSCNVEIMPIQAFRLPHHIRILAAGHCLSYLRVTENPDKLKSVTALLQIFRVFD